MRYNSPARLAAFAALARLLGEDVTGLSEASRRRNGRSRRWSSCGADIGIPTRLRELGVKEEQLRPFAEKAFGIKRILRVNPRTPTVDDLEGILRAAF